MQWAKKTLWSQLSTHYQSQIRAHQNDFSKNSRKVTWYPPLLHPILPMNLPFMQAFYVCVYILIINIIVDSCFHHFKGNLYVL